MHLINTPVEVISQFNTLGDILPLRMRLQGEDHELVTVKIKEIIYVKENFFAGIKTLDYGCKIMLVDRERVLELRYHVESHKWTIGKMLY